MEESAILKKIDEKYGAYYKSNTVLFKEGEKADKFFILREGLVKIVKTSPEMQITINTIEAGEVFGEMGLITNKPRNASGITLTECFIISLNEQILDTLITTNKKFVFYLLKLFGSKIRYLSSMVKDLTTGNDFVIITTHL
jgi:CRP-like cAMP-binding protein